MAIYAGQFLNLNNFHILCNILKISSSYIQMKCMFKKTFIRLMLLGTIVFASLFVLISANKTPDPINSDCIESDAKNENTQSQGDFILKSFIGSVLIGTD